MSGTEDEASANVWPDELNESARKPNTCRRIVILAAIAAAIFIFDATLVEPHVLSRVLRYPLSSLSGLFSTLCVLMGLWYLGSAGLTFFLASPQETPEYRRRGRRAIIDLLTGFGALVFPFVLATFDSGYYYGGYDPMRAARSVGSVLLIACGYAAFVCLIKADMLLGEAFRQKDEEASALKAKTAVCVLACFGLMAAPALYALWLGG